MYECVLSALMRWRAVYKGLFPVLLASSSPDSYIFEKKYFFSTFKKKKNSSWISEVWHLSTSTHESTVIAMIATWKIDWKISLQWENQHKFEITSPRLQREMLCSCGQIFLVMDIKYHHYAMKS